MMNNDLLDSPTSPPLGSNSESATRVAVNAPTSRRSIRTATDWSSFRLAIRQVFHDDRTSTERVSPSHTIRHAARDHSADLMQGDREIVIRHGSELYRLNVTRSGKLILRK